MFDAIATVLAWFYSLCGSYGGAIMLLTLAIMFVLTPLTLKGTRSMLAMQRLQPEMRKLQAKYKDDREKLNQELMAFYKANNINPVGGCLPLLVQMPVFFVLYRVLYGLTRRQPYGRDLGSSFSGLIQGGDGSYERFGYFDPDHLDRGTRLYEDLSNTNRMGSFGMDLAESAQKVLSSAGLVDALPYIVLVLIVAATSYIQQKQVSGRTPQGGQSPMNQQQQMLLKLMPLFFVFISFTLPAGIVLYFVVSNLFRVGQQAFITRTMYSGGTSGVIETTASDTTPSAGGIKGFLTALVPPKESLPDVKARPKGGQASPGKAGDRAKPAPDRRGPKASKGASPNVPAPTKANGAKNANGAHRRSKTSGSGGSPQTASNGPGGTKSPKQPDGAAAPAKDVSPAGKASERSKAPSRQQRPVAPPRSQPRKKRR